MTHFEMLYGRKPRDLEVTQLAEVSVPDLSTWLKEREIMKDMLSQRLHRVQQRMKHQADKHRSKREFAVGDFVYLKLQPYIQTFVASRVNQKLSFQMLWPI